MLCSVPWRLSYHAVLPYMFEGVKREAFNGPVGLKLENDDFVTVELWQCSFTPF
jgi:hypothetical protein